MRLLKIMLITLVLGGVSVLSPSCASKSASTPAGQVATVQRGDISISITGVGNLALADKFDLAFDIPSAFSNTKPIAVEEVSVKAGDSVKEGQVLAKLDTSLWDDQVTALDDTVTAAKRNVTSKERAVTQAELTALQKQSALNSAQLSLEQAEDTSTDPLQIRIAQLNLQVAQGNLAAANIAVTDAQTAVADAQKAVVDAQKNLDQAKSASPEVKAPFAGLITNVNVKGGDEVKKGTIAVTIADPSKFQADVMVSEINILQINIGENATAQLDALPGIALPAQVTAVTPSATISSGVVNYKVTVQIQPLQAVIQQRQTASGSASSANTSAGGQASARGNASSANTSASGQASPRQQTQTGQSTGRSSPSLATLAQNVQLREGMTATISIIMQQRSNVILVPKTAITQQGARSYVTVLQADTTEQRPIQTGISNTQYTEVISGVSEGEQVVIPKATTSTTTTTSSQQGQQSRGGIPGLGGIFR